MRLVVITTAGFAAFILSGAGLFAQLNPTASNSVSAILSSSSNTNRIAVLQDALRKVDVQIPDLKVVDINARTLGWRDAKNTTSAQYAFRSNPGRLDPHYTAYGKIKPSFDLRVDVAQYASSSDAEEAIEKDLPLRQVFPSKKENYRGGILYQYGDTPHHLICQHGQYVIEIQAVNTDASALTMNALSHVIGGLDSAPSDSK